MTTLIYNSTYFPIDLVRHTHAILHLNVQLQLESNQFGIYYNDYLNPYTYSLFAIPVICTAIGFLALSILQIALCCRVCFDCCRCMPSTIRKSLNRNSNSPAEPLNRSPRSPPQIKYLTIAFAVFCFATIAVDQTLIVGNSYLTDGVNTADNALNYLYNLFNELNVDGDQLVTEGNVLNNNILAAESTCPPASLLEGYFQTYFEYVDEYQNSISGVPDDINNAQNKLNLWGTTYKNDTIWVLYVFLIIGIFSYILFFCVKNKIGLQFSISLSEVVMGVILFFCGIEMILLMGLSDYCVSPIPNTLQVIPPNTDYYNITSYYATCSGYNPITPSIDSAQSLLNTTIYALNELLIYCPGNPYLEAALTDTAVIEYYLDDITNLTACPPTQSQFNQVLNTGVCDQTFRGFYTIWLAQYVTVACLFGCTIIVSFIYQYFGRYWNIDDEGDHELDSVLMSHAGRAEFEACSSSPTANALPIQYYYSDPRIQYDQNQILKPAQNTLNPVAATASNVNFDHEAAISE